MKAPLLGLVLLLAGCTAQAPKLVLPDSVESFCPGHAPRPAAIVSILSSVADAIVPIDMPNDGVLRATVEAGSGAIAHWKDEPLYMPGTAQALGVSGNYIDVTQLVITNELASADSRIIYVTVTTPAGPKRLGLRAYDTRNVCTAEPPPSPAS